MTDPARRRDDWRRISEAAAQAAQSGERRQVVCTCAQTFHAPNCDAFKPSLTQPAPAGKPLPESLTRPSGVDPAKALDAILCQSSPTPTDAAVEAVARALHGKCVRINNPGFYDPRPWEQITGAHQDNHREDARAALAALTSGARG